MARLRWLFGGERLSSDFIIIIPVGILLVIFIVVVIVLVHLYNTIFATDSPKYLYTRLPCPPEPSSVL